MQCDHQGSMNVDSCNHQRSATRPEQFNTNRVLHTTDMMECGRVKGIAMAEDNMGTDQRDPVHSVDNGAKDNKNQHTEANIYADEEAYDKGENNHASSTRNQTYSSRLTS